MPVATVNGINLSYNEYGSGEPVVLVPGTGARGRIWKTYRSSTSSAMPCATSKKDAGDNA
jgi:hypothetical protein